MTRRFALRSSRVVTPRGIEPATVTCEGETIVAVGAAAGVPTEDLGDLVLMPGLVDCHVHINEPGRTAWEGFETATRAAAAGGVTAVVDMPLNCTPVTTTVAALEQKLAALRGQLHVDTGCWAGVVPATPATYAGSRRPACSAPRRSCATPGSTISRPRPRRTCAARCPSAAAGIPLLAHAELELDAPACAAGARSYADWLAARPPDWEHAAIELLVTLCRDTGCAVHVVHLSSAGALPILRDARAAGLPITVETCPHYLCLTAEEIPDGATTYKCAPPIRGRANRDALWQGLRDGVIDFVISDHSPCTPGLKHLDAGDFGSAWGGIASLSLGLASVWTAARARGFDLARITEWLSAAPARFAGLAPRKGAIAAGADADFCVFDPDAHFDVVAERLHFKHRISPWLGRELSGEVRATWLRGEKIFEHGTFVSPPRGRALLGRSDAS